MANKPQQPKAPATQRFLDVAEVRDDLVILKDGSVRAVVLVSSINFALKSEDEQQAIIQGYTQFLNGLDHPIQIIVQSRKMNIDDYVKRMKEAEENLKNELLRGQMNDYIQFVQQIVGDGEIMSKRFYLVIPYDPGASQKKGFWERFKEVIMPLIRITLDEKSLARRKEEMNQRTSHVIGGLSSMGLSGIRLDTQGLIELLYDAYNPETSASQPMRDIQELQVETKYGF